MRALAAPFMIVFALTITLASFGWLLGLDPHWSGTIFGVYVFSGMTIGALATVILTVLWMRRAAMLGEGLVTEAHL